MTTDTSGIWVLASKQLPDIPEGQLKSTDVLAGFWYEDSWLKDEWQFSYGVCAVRLVDKCRDFPEGKRWMTHGCSHNQITHWMPLPRPPQQALTRPAAPQQAKQVPMSETHIRATWSLLDDNNTKDIVLRFARAVEAHHGIGGEA